jgi:DNA-binding MarR family transcriptional regulator
MLRSQILSEQTLAAWVAILRAHASVTRRLNAELGDAHGLTINDFEVLMLLARAPEKHLRRTDLATSVQLTPSGITRLLKGLESNGLVASFHCQSDGRVTWTALTDKGSEMLEAARATHHKGVAELVSAHFSDEELASLAALLGRLDQGPGQPGADGC